MTCLLPRINRAWECMPVISFEDYDASNSRRFSHDSSSHMGQISTLTLLLTVASALCAQSKNGTFTGELMDKQCAQMGSHENMMKTEGAKNAKECTLACVKNGGSFALLDPQTKKVYAIEDG